MSIDKATLPEVRPPKEVQTNIADDQDQDQDSQDIAYLQVALETKDKHDKEVESLKGLQQDREQRKEYAGKIFTLVCAWLFVLAVIIGVTGLKWLALSDNVLIALITGASLNIIGLMVIVANYLFPKSR